MSNPRHTADSKDRRLARGVKARKLILQSAITSIASQGLSNTTLDRVADLAGVSRTLVLFHFKSKNRLYTEVLEYLGKQFEDGWNALAGRASESTEEKLLAYLRYDIKFACENPKYVSAWHAFWGESKGNILFHELALPRDERYDSELKLLLKELIDTQGGDQEELQAISDAFGAMTYGFWLDTHLDPTPQDYARAMAGIRLFLRKIFPGISLPPSD